MTSLLFAISNKRIYFFERSLLKRQQSRQNNTCMRVIYIFADGVLAADRVDLVGELTGETVGKNREFAHFQPCKRFAVRNIALLSFEAVSIRLL